MSEYTWRRERLGMDRRGEVSNLEWMLGLESFDREGRNGEVSLRYDVCGGSRGKDDLQRSSLS